MHVSRGGMGVAWRIVASLRHYSYMIHDNLEFAKAKVKPSHNLGVWDWYATFRELTLMAGTGGGLPPCLSVLSGSVLSQSQQ